MADTEKHKADITELSIDTIRSKMVGNVLKDNKSEAVSIINKISDSISLKLGKVAPIDAVVSKVHDLLSSTTEVDSAVVSQLADTSDEIAASLASASSDAPESLGIGAKILAALEKLVENIKKFFGQFINGFRSLGDEKDPETIEAPNVIVHFRPKFKGGGANWHGEFGFDWMREGDTTLFNDYKFEDIVGKQYHNVKSVKQALLSSKVVKAGELVKDINEYRGAFDKNDQVDKDLFEKLKTKYEQLNFSKIGGSAQNTKQTYYIPWMSIVKIPADVFQLEYGNAGKRTSTKSSHQKAINAGARAELQLLLEVDKPADYLEFADNPNFIFSPKKIDISSYKVSEKKIVINKPVIVTCIQEFTQDSEIIINAMKGDKSSLAGKINVVANHSKDHKKLKVVFVEVLLPGETGETLILSEELERLKPFLRQAYIFLHEDSEVLDSIDLSADTSVSKFKYGNGWHDSTADGKARFHDYLADKVRAIHKEKFKDHLPIFFVNGHSGRGLGGYSWMGHILAFPAGGVATIPHEVVHAVSISHTFTNKEADKRALITYEYAKTDNIIDYAHHVKESGPCCTYHWQWHMMNRTVKSNGSVNKTLVGHSHGHGHDHVHFNNSPYYPND